VKNSNVRSGYQFDNLLFQRSWECGAEPFGQKEAESAARIREQLEKKGTPIGPYDILIGGTALCIHATLVTHNLKEFKRIKDLHVIDWY